MLVGRRAERAVIEGVLGSAVNGRTAAAVLLGAPGCGKTALLEEGASMARDRGFTVLTVTGREEESHIAFGGLAALLRPIEPLPAEEAGTSSPALDAVFGLQGANADLNAVRVAALRALLLAAGRTPLLLVVDDVQWLDEPTLDVVLFVENRLGADPVALLLGARREPPSLRTRAFTRVAVGAMNPDELAAVVTGELQVAPDVATWCVARAQGNPLAALEFGRALTGAQRSGRDLPPLVPAIGSAAERACASHLAGLDEHVRRCLVVVAADTTGEVRVVTRALELLGEDPLALDQAEALGLVGMDGATVAVWHPLLRSLAYHQVAPASRRAAHRALAVALDRPQDAEARAWQLAAAAAGPDEAAAEGLDLVARRSWGRGAPSAAGGAAMRAATLSSDATRRAGRLVEATRAWLEAGEIDRACDAAEALLEVVLHAPDEAVAVSVAALALRWHGGPRLAATRLLGLSEEAGAGSMRDLLLAVVADEFMVAGELARAARLGPGDAVLAAHAGTADRGALRAAAAAMATGDLGVVADILDRAFPPGPRRGPFAVAADALRAACRMRAGDVLGAYAASDELVRLGVAGPQSVGADLVAARCEAILGGGASCRSRLDRILDVAGRLGLGGALVDAYQTRALLALAEGEATRAVDDLRSATCAMAGWGWPRSAGDAWVELIEALALAGQGAEASALVATLQAGIGPWAEGRAARAAGIAGRDRSALDRAISRLVPFPFEQARALLARGELARREMDANRAEADFGDAAGLFGSLGALPWAERAGAAGAAHAGPLASLTSAEVRVALEVGQGRSNREAAEALFLSVKTVDFHLQSIYRKLQIRSRSELAALVGRASVAVS